MTEVPYFVYWGLEIWKRSSNIWRCFTAYRHRAVMELAVQNFDVMVILSRYENALRLYAKSTGQDGGLMMDDWKVRMVVLNLLHNLSRYATTDFLAILLRWAPLLYFPKKDKIDGIKKLQLDRDLGKLPIDVKLAKVTMTYLSWWYGTNNITDVKTGKRSWTGFWEMVDGKFLKYINRQRMRKEIVWLVLWWSVNPPKITEEVMMQRPKWDPSLFYEETELFSLEPVSVNKIVFPQSMQSYYSHVNSLPTKRFLTKGLDDEDLLEQVSREMKEAGLKRANKMDVAVEEGWSISKGAKRDLINKLLEWVETSII